MFVGDHRSPSRALKKHRITRNLKPLACAVSWRVFRRIMGYHEHCWPIFARDLLEMFGDSAWPSDPTIAVTRITPWYDQATLPDR